MARRARHGISELLREIPRCAIAHLRSALMRAPERRAFARHFFTVFGSVFAGACGFFGTTGLALSTALLMSSISLVTRAALLPRSLSKWRDAGPISTRASAPSEATRIETSA